VEVTLTRPDKRESIAQKGDFGQFACFAHAEAAIGAKATLIKSALP
jgi:hypothetical protein